jgi:hypothetical protein
MTPSAETIANALEGKRYGDGWRSACPVHGGDSGSSFSIRESADGKVLLHCFAGCDQTAVIDALRSRGLWPDHRHEERRSRSGTPLPSRLALLRELEHELHVLLQVVGAKLTATELRGPERAAFAHPSQRPTDPPLERELLAARRIDALIGAIYLGRHAHGRAA